MVIRWTLFALGAAVAFACGGGDPPVMSADGETLQLDDEPAAAPVERARTGNEAPVIERLSLDPESPRPGEQVVARVEATDPDGDAVALEYRWMVGGKRVSENGPFLHVEGAGRGAEIELVVVASDGTAKSRPETATARVGNLAPRVLQVVIEPLGEVIAGRDIVATPGGTDPDGDPIEYRYTWTVNGETASADTSTLPASHYGRGDEIVLEVVASDGVEDSDPLQSAAIKVVNAPPRVTSSPGAIGEDGVFRYEVQAEDPDGDSSFRYRLLNAPDGMTIGFDDGKLEWAPGPGVEGNHSVEIEVTDLFGGKGNQLFELRLSYAAEDVPAAADDVPAAADDGGEDEG